MPGQKKKPAASKAAGKKKSETKPKKQKSDVRKIYKTTDGYLAGNERSKKPRRVAVVKQRKDDGAMAVVKIYSKKRQERESVCGKAGIKTRESFFAYRGFHSRSPRLCGDKK